jgi:hypothetical protein
MENEGSKECHSCKRRMDRTCTMFRPVVEHVVVHVRFTKTMAPHDEFDNHVFVCWECQQKIFEALQSLARRYDETIGCVR